MPMCMDMGMGMGETIDGMNGSLGMDMGMGMGMGMEMGLQMGMPVGGDMMGVGMPGMGMMMDGTGTGMMDANGMMIGNGMSNGGMPDMPSGVDMGADTGAAPAPVNEIGAGTAAAVLGVAVPVAPAGQGQVVEDALGQGHHHLSAGGAGTRVRISPIPKNPIHDHSTGKQ